MTCNDCSTGIPINIRPFGNIHTGSVYVIRGEKQYSNTILCGSNKYVCFTCGSQSDCCCRSG